MVTLRGKGIGDADQNSGRTQKHTTARSSETPPRSPPETRSRKSGPCNGFTSKDEEQSHVNSETHNEEERKCKMSFDNTDGRRSGPRRSTRSTKPTSRYQASNMLDGLSSNPTRSVRTTMDNMRRKRRLSNHNEGRVYAKTQKRRTPESPVRDLSESEEDQGPVPEEESRQEVAAGDDSSCSMDRNFDAKLNRTSWLCQGPSSEFPKGTFRISASGPNTTRRGAFRATKSTWSSQSDDDNDSDDDLQNTDRVPESCHPLGMRTDGAQRDKMSSVAGLADIDPMAIDQSVGFKSIGGLSGHISALKEMVVFPLLYPEVFDNFKIQPPRGCLFYGPPGTGKTLVARALANECSHGNRKVSFFMRKGADCLSKWVGESERQLRLLFKQAYQMRPSIIFFDEIDGLAPVRSSRQDQIHSSIVSTLLALMDGLDSRGEVVVIGATNRLDSIDPALRRPGRFDREFLFGLPDRESRKEILKIHMLQWKPRPSEDFLDELAEKCVGYCGADIRAVCTEAALCALRRRYPQIYSTSQKLLLDISSIAVSSCDFVVAMRKITPACHRLTTTPAKPLLVVVQPLLGAALRDIMEALQRLFPHVEQGLKRRREPDLTPSNLDDGLMCGKEEDSCSTSISVPSSSMNTKFLHFSRSAVRHPTSHRPRLLLAGRPGAGQTSHLAPAVLHALERFSVHSLDSAMLYGVSSTSPEEACAQVFIEAKRTSPSILYLPHIQQWWETAGPALRASFFSLLDSIPSFSPILLLATCRQGHQQLDPEVQSLFQEEHGEVYTINAPTQQERNDFFQDLILNQAAEVLPSKTVASLGGADSEETEGSALSPNSSGALRKKRYKQPRRSKWSRGIIKKPKKKLLVPVSSSSSSFSSSPSSSSCSSSPSSSSLSSLSSSLSDLSESSYEKQSPPASNGDHSASRGVRVNGFYRPRTSSILRVQTQTSKTPLTQKKAVDRVCLRTTENHQRVDSRASQAALEQMQMLSRGRFEEKLNVETPQLIVDHSKLKDLLRRAVSKTDGLEAEPLEKLYTLLAQSIYRHRHSYNKSELIQPVATRTSLTSKRAQETLSLDCSQLVQETEPLPVPQTEMKKDIDSFS